MAESTSVDAEVVTDTPEVDVDPTTIVEAVEVGADEETANVGSAVDVRAAIAALNNPESGFYSSIKGGDFTARKAVAKAMTNSLPFDDHIGKTVSLVNVIIIPVTLRNKQTGAPEQAPRTLLIDADGVVYNSTGTGVLTAVTSLFTALGEPGEWEGPVDVQFAYGKGNNGFKYHTLNLV